MKSKFNKKGRRAKKRNNRKLKRFIKIIIVIILGIIIYNKIIRKDSEKKDTELLQNQITTEDLKEKAPLIDMENTKNANIQHGEKINISEKLKNEKVKYGLKFTNIRLHTESGISHFNATVENISQKTFLKRTVTLLFKDDDGNVFASVETIIPEIEQQGKKQINVSTTADIANASDVEFDLND